MRWRAFGRLGVWWLVAAGSAVGLGLVIFADALRMGGRVVAASFLVGAALRLLVPTPRGGGLEVRHRLLDVGVLLGLALAIGLAFSLVKARSG